MQFACDKTRKKTPLTDNLKLDSENNVHDIHLD